jgi:hypothetical protein
MTAPEERNKRNNFESDSESHRRITIRAARNASSRVYLAIMPCALCRKGRKPIQNVRWSKSAIFPI